MSDKKETKSEYIKKDGHIDFDKMTHDIHLSMLLMKGLTWVINPKIRWFEFIAYAIVGSAWMSLLMFYIWTGKLLLLQIWATPIAAILILMCIVEGFKALRKKDRSLSDLMDETYGSERKLSKDDFTKLHNSLSAFNDYERNVQGVEFKVPSYKEYKEYVLSIKPELIYHENLIKAWYTMFEKSKWTVAGFNISDWKLQTNTILKVFISDSLNGYINFYKPKEKKTQDESGTPEI